MKRFFFAIFILITLLSINIVDTAAFSIGEFINLDGFVSTNNQKEMTLLAVQENQFGDFKGSLAIVTLETRRGSGRVFLDTFPLSKIDTQISTRFAKEIACKYMDVNCDMTDFIYTLRSDSGIIGGPSAGAAISVLTLAVIKNLELDSGVAMTGTINSGGIIGPVSGIKYKIDAAAAAGLTKVLVPKGSIIEDDDNSVVYSPSEYGVMQGIKVVEVSDLNDAIFEFTGKYVHHYDSNIEIPSKYVDTMRAVADDLCNRTQTLYQIMKDMFEVTDFSSRGRIIAENLQDDAIGLMARAESSNEFGYFYATASFCYGANINFMNMILLQQGLVGNPLFELINNTESKIDELESFVESLQLRTISDFEVFVIMKERIEAAKGFIESAKSSYFNRDIYSVYRHLAYAMERHYTAEVWKDFLGMDGKQFSINEEVLRNSCIDKLSEAQERIQYITLFVPEQSVIEIKRDFDNALRDYNKGEYALCISKASKAKSSVNVLMSIMAVRSDDLEDLLDLKLNSVRRIIIQQQQKGVFPIMGYSYYEYAKSLRDSDPISSLIYVENALELSWLDIYFESPSLPRSIRLNPIYAILVLIGFIVGLIFVISLIPKKSRSLRFGRRKIRKKRHLRK